MISIITPVHNGNRFMEACIANVNGQQCFDMEHLIVDGGSTDGTVEIIKQHAGKYGHIRWVSEKDCGQSDAMNKGIALAQGEIIGFLNVDDYYEPDVLNKIVEHFKTLPEPTLLAGNCNVWDNEGQLHHVNKPSNLYLPDLMIWRRNVFPHNPSAYFYHKSLHEKIGPYDIHEHFAMDMDFLIRALMSAQAVYLDETLGNYRFIEGAKTYTDTLNGQTPIRLQKLIKRYKRKLPWRLRLRVDRQNGRDWVAVRLHELYLRYCGFRKRFLQG